MYGITTHIKSHIYTRNIFSICLCEKIKYFHENKKTSSIHACIIISWKTCCSSTCMFQPPPMTVFVYVHACVSVCTARLNNYPQKPTVLLYLPKRCSLRILQCFCAMKFSDIFSDIQYPNRYWWTFFSFLRLKLKIAKNGKYHFKSNRQISKHFDALQKNLN